MLLASHEAFGADAAELRSVTWEVALLDERQRGQRASLAKAHQVRGWLHGVQTPCRWGAF